MRYKIFLFLFFYLTITNIAISQVNGETNGHSDVKNYDRTCLLLQFANIINRHQLKGSVHIDSVGGINYFFVYDLIDTLNYQNADNYSGTKTTVQFLDGHIYHFAFIFRDRSFSNIAYLDNGKVVFFEVINCPEKSKTSLEKVLEYFTIKLKSSQNSEEILKRIKNYRHFGKYRSMDNFGHSLRCDLCS